MVIARPMPLAAPVTITALLAEAMFISSGIAIGGQRPWSGGTCPEPWVDTCFPDADLSIDAPAGHHKSMAPQRGRGAAQHLSHGGYGRRLSRPGVSLMRFSMSPAQ